MKVSCAVLFVASLFAGCASVEKTLQSKAEFDLSCPKEKLKITDLGGYSYGAEGCGTKASYICSSSGFTAMCTKTSENMKVSKAEETKNHKR